MDNIESEVDYLELIKRFNRTSYFLLRLQQVQNEINGLDHFVNLKVNKAIQNYWNPKIREWRERLAAIL